MAQSALDQQQNQLFVDAEGLPTTPLEKGGIAVCKRCAYVGFTRLFYPKQKEFCSKSCSLSFSMRAAKKIQVPEFHFDGSTDHFEGMIPMEPLPQVATPWPIVLDDLGLRNNSKAELFNIANSYEWKEELFGCDFLAAPVRLFKHAPLNDMWDDTFEGMKVEVKNTDCEITTDDYFWVATVVKVKGYMGLMRYEGFGSDDSKDFWVNLCCSDVHPVGWCATRGKPLIPPQSIEDKYTDWKKFLVNKLTGARTLPANFYNKFKESCKSRFVISNFMEVVDKNRISQVKLATVTEIIGKRLHVKYYDSSPEDNGFWCHEDSPLIHHVGWAFSVGHTLDAPPVYCERVAAGVSSNLDTNPDMFYTPTFFHLEYPPFVEGMKLEAVDPLNLSSICAATVMRVLNHGYMMIRIDVYPPDATGADWFCYHQRSPCIFPVGFCEANDIILIPPAGFTKESFSWHNYLRETGAVPAGQEYFAPRSSAEHGFVTGMRLECTDLMDPRLVCVATVARVLGNMLKIHFDGWGSEYDQWLWGGSTDMYPVGWARAVGHRLEGPLQPAPPPPRKVSKVMRNKRRKNKANNQQVGQQKRSAAVAGKAISMHSNEDSQTSMNTEPQCIPKLHCGNFTGNGSVSETKSQDVKEDTENELYEDDCIQLNTNQQPAAEEYLKHDDHSQHQENLQLQEDSQHQTETQNEEESQQKEDSEHQEDSHDQDDSDLQEEDNSQHQNEEENEEFMEDDSMQEEMESEVEKPIPCLVGSQPLPLDIYNTVDPTTWNQRDVATFLTINDCQPYCVNFGHVNGIAMLQLTKDEIIELLELKVGPSLKIFHLIQQLKSKIKPQRLVGLTKK